MASARVSAGAGSALRPDPMTLVAFVVVVVTGGLNAIAVRQTLGELTPFWSAALRFMLAALIMVSIVLVSDRGFPRGRSLVGAAAYGAVGFAASYAFIYSGLVEAPASAGAVLLALTPLFTFGLAIIQGQERYRLEGFVGAVVAMLGVAVIFADQLGADVPLASLVLIVLGVLCIAESGVIVKWIPRGDPFGTNAVAMTSGGLILLALTIVSGEPVVLPSGPEAISALVYLVLLGTVVLFGAYVYALTRWTASAVSYATLLMPLVAVPTAAILTGEPITLLLLVGGAIILAGVYVGAFLRRPRRLSASSSPECLPVDGCAEVEVTSSPATGR